MATHYKIDGINKCMFGFAMIIIKFDRIDFS